MLDEYIKRRERERERGQKDRDGYWERERKTETDRDREGDGFQKKDITWRYHFIFRETKNWKLFVKLGSRYLLLLQMISGMILSWRISIEMEINRWSDGGANESEW